MIGIRDSSKGEKGKNKSIEKEYNNFKDKVRGGRSLKKRKNLEKIKTCNT